MSDEIVIKAKSSTDVQNGSMITFVQETGTVAAASGSAVNTFVPSGTHYSRLNTRYDDYAFGVPNVVTSGV